MYILLDDSIQIDNRILNAPKPLGRLPCPKL